MQLEQKIIVANWKSNHRIQDVPAWFDAFVEQDPKTTVEYILCPPFPLLSAVQTEIAKRGLTQVSLGLQDISAFGAGAYTGATSAFNVQGLGVTHVIVGHSERRRYFDETSVMVAQKIEAALASDLIPILCVDRDEAEKQAELLTAQQRARIIVAYEPVHAISTFGGHEDPIETTLSAVEQISVFFDGAPLIYGGSVDPENSLTYLQQATIHGVLVGSSSLDGGKFARL